MPAITIAQLKTLANSRDVPYQSLLKIFLAQRLEAEFRSRPEIKMTSSRANCAIIPKLDLFALRTS